MMGESHALSSENEVAGVVLASGLSKRLPGVNKLLLPINGVPVIRRTVLAYCQSGLTPVVVVVGYQAVKVREGLHGLDVLTVENPNFRQGQSRALVRGVTALPDHVRAAVIGVGDQPYLRSATIVELVQVWRSAGASLIVPRYAGRRGNPVLFARSLFPELLEVQGDQGGRPVIERHGDEAAWIDVPDGTQAADIDTMEDYGRLTGTATTGHRPADERREL